MRKALATILLALAGVAVSVRPASAQWDWLKWLEELSGPGHFVMWGPDVTLFCKTKAQPAGAQQITASPYKYFECDKDPRGTVPNWKQVTSFYGVRYLFGQGTNPLDYPSGVTKKSHTSAHFLSFQASRRSSSVTDLGAGVGFWRFAGAEDHAFNKVSVEGYAAVRPFATNSHRWLERFFELRVGAIVFPEG